VDQHGASVGRIKTAPRFRPLELLLQMIFGAVDEIPIESIVDRRTLKRPLRGAPSRVDVATGGRIGSDGVPPRRYLHAETDFSSAAGNLRHTSSRSMHHMALQIVAPEFS
jgi:hypothetical protein